MISVADFKTTKILVVGFGEIGKKVTEKIKKDRLIGVDTVFIDSGVITLKYDETWQPDTFNGAEMIIIVFDAADANKGLAYIAANARKKGILVLGMATKSFFPDIDEEKACEEAISSGIDALNIVYRDKVVEYYPRNQFIKQKYSAESSIIRSIQQIVLVMNVPIVVNIDLADLRGFLKKKGIMQLGYGYGRGENKAADAVAMAFDSCPRTPDISMATKFICVIFGDITLMDASDVCETIRELPGDDKDIIFGASYDDSLEDACSVMVIATDFVQSRMAKCQTDCFGVQILQQTK